MIVKLKVSMPDVPGDLPPKGARKVKRYLESWLKTKAFRQAADQAQVETLAYLERLTGGEIGQAQRIMREWGYDIK